MLHRTDRVNDHTDVKGETDERGEGVALFRAVIIQAITDACSNMMDMSAPIVVKRGPLWRKVNEAISAGKVLEPRRRQYFNRLYAKACSQKMNSRVNSYRTAERNRDQAREWLTTFRQDFRDVCELAAVNPDSVRAMGLELRADDWPFRGI